MTLTTALGMVMAMTLKIMFRLELSSDFRLPIEVKRMHASCTYVG